MSNKIFDCITFFNENFITNTRFEILNEVVDYFVVCESIYDHRGQKKKLNFKLINKNYDSKLIYIVLEDKFESQNLWKNQAKQREFIFKGLKSINEEDYVMFSDPDEIPSPEILNNFKLTKKYGIFFQKCFCYKINIFNQFETPWEGTRIVKYKNLSSIDYLRQKIISKNLKYNFLRIDKEKNIEIIKNGGWHFNNLMSPEDISLKLKTFAHSEFSDNKFSSVDVIEEKIKNKVDLFNRGHRYQKIEIDKNFPDYILDNLTKFDEYIIKN